MSVMTIPLPEAIEAFLNEQVSGGSFGSNTDYVLELIRREQDRQRLRGLLLEGASSGDPVEADEVFFAELRALASGG